MSYYDCQRLISHAAQCALFVAVYITSGRLEAAKSLGDWNRSGL